MLSEDEMPSTSVMVAQIWHAVVNPANGENVIAQTARHSARIGQLETKVRVATWLATTIGAFSGVFSSWWHKS